VRVSEQVVLAQMAAEERVTRKSPEVVSESPGSPPEVPGSAEPIDAAYRVTPVEIEQAIERTGQKYMTDMAALYDRISGEVGRLYEGQLAAKDETIATQRAALAKTEQALAADALAIAELRRRAEQAEAERDRLAATQATPAAPGAQEASAAAQGDAPGVWGRLARWWRGA